MPAFTTVPLGEIANFVRGITFKPDDVVPVGSTGSAACMRTKNVQANLDLTDVWGVPLSFVKRKNQFLEAGDILVSSANSWNLVGKCCFIPELPWPATFGGFVTVLRSQHPKMDPRFLYRWFNSDKVQATVRSFGQQTTNISNLNIDRCLSLPVPFPPLAEQRRIAEVLDRAEALRAKRREALAQLDTLTQAIFLDLFGDPIANPQRFPVVPLADLIEPQRPITYGILKPGPDQTVGVPYVRVVDMKDGGIDCSGLRKTSGEIAAAYRRSKLKGGDLLLSIRGHVGRLATTPPELDGANITQDTARLSVAGASSVFVRECLRTAQLQRWMDRHTKGVAVRGINLGDVKIMPIITPPMESQDRFAAQVQAIESLRKVHLASLQSTDALFVSLQDRAFKGTLWDEPVRLPAA